MKKTVLHNRTTLVFVGLIITYVLSTIATISILSTLIKYMLLLLVLIIYVLYTKSTPVLKKGDFLFTPLIIFFGLYLITIRDIDSTMIVINQISLYLYTFVLYRFTWKKSHIKTFAKIFYMSIPFILLGIALKGRLVNENTLAAIILYTSFFPILYKYGYQKDHLTVRLLPMVGLTAILLLASGSRSAFLAGSAGLVTFVMWKKINSSKLLSKIYLFLVYFAIYAVTVIYPTIDQYQIYHKLNYWSLTLFQKPIFTGRNTIWKNLLGFISESPIWGHGASAAPEDFYQTTLSSHNLYLQTALQVGVVGIVFLGIFFYLLWKYSAKSSFDPRIRVTASFLVIIMVHQIFEVTLTQNQFLVSLLQWTIIGIGMSFISKSLQPDSELLY